MAGFSVNTAKRIAKSTRRVEQNPRNQIGRPLGPRYAVGGLLVKTTSTVGTHTVGTSLGSGTAVVQTIAHDGSYAPMKGSPVVTVFSMSSSATIASGLYVLVNLVNGRWVIDVVVC